jgi:hypothetical protein
MGRRKHIGTTDKLLGCGAQTRAHRNFLDSRGSLRAVRSVKNVGRRIHLWLRARRVFVGRQLKATTCIRCVRMREA